MFIMVIFVDYLVLSVVDLLYFIIDCMMMLLIMNLLGVKGVGEVGMIVFILVVVNFVFDVVCYFGVSDIEMLLIL